MKIRTLALAIACAATLTQSSTSTAQARGATRPDSTLICDTLEQGEHFQILTDPHDRYIQTTRVDLAEAGDRLMRAFQEPGEQPLQVLDAALHLELDPGACTLDQTSTSHFLECRNATDANIAGNFHFSRVHFTSHGKSALGAPQTVVVDRELHLVSVSIHAEVQPKQGPAAIENRVVLTLTVNALVGTQARTLQLTKDLGEWTARTDRSNWNRCLVTKG